MAMARWTFLLAVTAVGAILGGVDGRGAHAGGYCSDLALTCENGRTYPLCPIAISDQGELVTAHLVLGPGRGTHVRLIPLGNGYRYAGRGVWFDGIRQEATLFFGMHSSPVQCQVLKP
jgi:hypothetical protein